MHYYLPPLVSWYSYISTEAIFPCSSHYLYVQSCEENLARSSPSVLMLNLTCTVYLLRYKLQYLLRIASS